MEHLARTIHASSDLELQLIVSGSHLLASQGRTIEEVKASGIPVSAEIPIVEGDPDTDLGRTQIFARMVANLSPYLASSRPDALIVLGDRFEVLAAASLSHLLHIPLIHLHGGEETQGALDDSFRHAITALSELHFTAHETYRDRVIRMGKPPKQVFAFGPMIQDRLAQMTWLTQSELEKELGISIGQNLILATFHPETVSARRGHSSEGVALGIDLFLEGLSQVMTQFPDAQVIFTYANLDEGGEWVNQRIDAFASQNSQRVFVRPSLGQARFLSLMKLAKVVAGNSSSGVIEAPLLGTPTLNVGDRQKGRLRAESIVDVPLEVQEIVGKLRELLGKKNPSSHPGDELSSVSPRILKEIRSWFECHPRES